MPQSSTSAEIDNQGIITHHLPQFPPHLRNKKTWPRQNDRGWKCCFSPLLPSQTTFWLSPSDLRRAEACSHLCCVFPGLSEAGWFNIPGVVSFAMARCYEDKLVDTYWVTKLYDTITKLDLSRFFFSHWASIPSPASTLACTILFCSSWDSNSGSQSQRSWG